jgi:hypothetical protein
LTRAAIEKQTFAETSIDYRCALEAAVQVIDKYQ